jgi:hypothetical protein
MEVSRGQKICDDGGGGDDDDYDDDDGSDYICIKASFPLLQPLLDKSVLNTWYWQSVLITRTTEFMRVILVA